MEASNTIRHWGVKILKKRVSLIALTEPARIYLEGQLGEYISDIAEIKGYSMEKGLDNFEAGQLLVLSSETMRSQLEGSPVLESATEVVVARRTINYDFVDKIVLIPKGTNVLFVNDSKKTTFESINTLKRLGIDHINYIPCYPGSGGIPGGIDVCITAGEMDKVPSGMKEVYDIGIRIIDFPTIAEVLNRLDALDERAGRFSDKYLVKLTNVAKRLARSTQEIGMLYEDLNIVIDGFNDGILVYDHKGVVRVFNENLKKMLQISSGYKVIDRHIKDVVCSKKLAEILMSPETQRTEVISMDGFEMVVNKIFLTKNNSFIAIIRSARQAIEENEKIKRELVNKGFYAKYTFDDIIGSSAQINRTKDICARLAGSDLTILIEGESGTGKELFASAIHNSSDRASGPFLAVNFSALPDELIESELFGYEEGAFTGALKGGKAGLFEQADGGTIFLDEIGDISIKVQARLLRVLQEKEVMRIGARKINSVDVRIIAATNRNLVQMVSEKKFREDLYYRLKIGHVKIPPLRSRKEDIEELVRHFVKTDTSDCISVFDDVIERLVQQDWHGNIRELKNTISYMLAVRKENVLTADEMPENHYFVRGQAAVCDSSVEQKLLSSQELLILQAIYVLKSRGEVVGRDKISEYVKKQGIYITSHQIRNRLDKLQDKGFVIKGRGKIGTLLTVRGETIANGSSGNIK